VRRPRPATYREALDAIQDAHLALRSILAGTRLPQQAREQLQLLADRLLVLLNRDDDRTR
jgi:hypothetical protein